MEGQAHAPFDCFLCLAILHVQEVLQWSQDLKRWGDEMQHEVERLGERLAAADDRFAALEKTNDAIWERLFWLEDKRVKVLEEKLTSDHK